ncbi:GNAT family N-acetyltransferase [Streptomyces sp. NPDC004111]|uniref:GNAT family N-acetyltransferase n=1 Tax=Streptomyces sp. NPDC004111 TaxID=3364690 RepID=UPI00369517F6
MTTATTTPLVRAAEPADIDELIRLRAYLLDGDGPDDDGRAGPGSGPGEQGRGAADRGGGSVPLPYTATGAAARAAWRAGYRAWLQEKLPHDAEVCVAVAPGPGRLRACALAVLDQRPPSPAYPSGRAAWMQTLVTDPRDRGQGLGTAVVDHLFDWARARGVDVAVMQSADGAVEFHRRAGWLPTGEGLYYQPVAPGRTEDRTP